MDYSLADIKAITDHDDYGAFGGEGGWFWIILIFLFFLAFGGNGLGSNSITQAELQQQLYNQNLINASNQNSRDILESSCSTQKEILKTQYDTAMGFANVNQNVCQLGYQMQQCCCDLKTQMLQDKYDATLNELNLARMAATNSTQTQNILSTIGQWRAYPAVNPYTCYNTTCGCCGVNI